MQSSELEKAISIHTVLPPQESLAEERSRQLRLEGSPHAFMRHGRIDRDFLSEFVANIKNDKTRGMEPGLIEHFQNYVFPSRYRGSQLEEAELVPGSHLPMILCSIADRIGAIESPLPLRRVIPVGENNVGVHTDAGLLGNTRIPRSIRNLLLVLPGRGVEIMCDQRNTWHKVSPGEICSLDILCPHDARVSTLSENIRNAVIATMLLDNTKRRE